MERNVICVSLFTGPLLAILDGTQHRPVTHVTIHFLNSYVPGAIYNDDAEGFWSIGGYDNFPSFKGVVAEVTMYRKYLLYPEDVRWFL